MNHRIRSCSRCVEQIRGDIVVAAIDVIGRLGIGGLTHRAVAACADVSLSSTTYHFASRDDIIAAAFQQATALVESLDKQDPTTARAELAASLLDEVIGFPSGGQTALRAQYELQLYAVNQPAMREGVRAWSQEVEAVLASMLAALGASRPDVGARILTAAVDGLRLTALTTAQSAEEVEADSAALSELVELLLK